MVDALSRAGRCLAAGGRLVDIHPTAEPAHIEVRTPEGIVSAGDLVDEGTDRGPRRRHAAASKAIADVVALGWFTLEGRREFAFRRYADSAAELRAYVAGARTHSWIDEETERRAAVLLQANPPGSLWLREQVTIARLTPRQTRRV
jgi:hypothetical protein